MTPAAAERGLSRVVKAEHQHAQLALLLLVLLEDCQRRESMYEAVHWLGQLAAQLYVVDSC